MDHDAIAVFVKVVEVQSFSGAARLLEMPKTTVSAKIAALEKRLNTRLIHRTTRKLRVTEAGSRYFHHCANAVREMELGEAELQSTQSEPAGVLRVTAPVDVGHFLLPQITQAYLARYPGTSVELLVSNRTVDLVEEGVDLAIRAGTLKDSSLITRRFLSIGSGLFASPACIERLGRVSHPRDLARAAFVSFKGFDTLRLVKGRAEFNLPIAGRILTDDLAATKALAVLGEGIVWLPDFLAADAVRAGTLLPVLPQWRSKTMGTLHFVYAGRRYASPKVQAFIEVALNAIQCPP
jgi:DNA-binding transcriptional LysR family regulator